MLEPHPLLRVEKNIRRPQLRSPQREDFGVAGEKRHRENDHDQYFNGLLETPLGRMPYLRRRHTANAAGDPRAYRPAHREPCAIHVHEYRTDRAILLGFLSEMEQRSLL